MPDFGNERDVKPVWKKMYRLVVRSSERDSLRGDDDRKMLRLEGSGEGHDKSRQQVEPCFCGQTRVLSVSCRGPPRSRLIRSQESAA
jgi:hypothetical protein